MLKLKMRKIKKKLHIRSQIRKILKHKNAIHVAVVSVGIFFVAAMVWTFVRPYPVQVSYSGSTCFGNLRLFPGLSRSQPSQSYDIEFKPLVSLGTTPLLSKESCVQVRQAPKENSKETVKSWLFTSLLARRYEIYAPQFPKLKASSLEASQLISVKEPITITLEQADKTFSYRLLGANKSVECKTTDTQLSCDTQVLGLAQATKYELIVQRIFKSQPSGEVLKQTITTTSPVEVAASSLPSGGLMYDKARSIVFTANKPLKSVNKVSLLKINEPKKAIPVESSFNGAQVTVTFKEELARLADFELIIEDITAEDKGTLAAPYKHTFKTSGGPKVSGINVRSYSVEPSQDITLTFDQQINPAQNISTFATIEYGGGAQAATVSRSGNKLVINPNAIIPLCTAFAVVVKDGLQNQFGVAGGSAYRFSSRTRCYTKSSIGTSARGRTIEAYRFGSGPSKVLYVGATHGSERGTKSLLDKWVNELEANPGKIPAHRTIIIIPNLNPDGYAANSRTNANGVDLNRNFPANNWKAGVTMPGGAFAVNGGGSEPLSEPESRALANFVRAERPRLVLTYHSKAPVVIGNGSGDSISIATTYAQKSRYRHVLPGASAAMFHYDTTGAFEDWLHDSVGIPAILIELSSHTSDDYSRNVSAMWFAAQL